MIFLAGRDRYTQRTLLRAIHGRLSKQAGCESVRYDPSRRRPRTVVANIEPTAFLGSEYDAETVRLEVRFWYPEGVDYGKFEAKASPFRAGMKPTNRPC